MKRYIAGVAKDVYAKRKHIVLMLLIFVLGVVVSFAQTPVPIEVDVNEIFISTNSWITVFTPIIAIGVGISIALALLTFIGRQIIGAFRGGGNR
jgi:putative Mn2+ efflux pump MntP